MADLVQSIVITQRMLHMRDTLRSFWGAAYTERLSEWRSTIQTVAAGKSIDPLKAAIELMKAAEGKPFAIMAIAAACVEIVDEADQAHRAVVSPGRSAV